MLQLYLFVFLTDSGAVSAADFADGASFVVLTGQLSRLHYSSSSNCESRSQQLLDWQYMVPRICLDLYLWLKNWPSA